MNKQDLWVERKAFAGYLKKIRDSDDADADELRALAADAISVIGDPTDEDMPL